MPMLAPFSLFVWSAARIVPVRITDFSVTEEAFDPQLNPLRAKVSLGMQVLSSTTSRFADKGGNLYMAYQRQKESLAQLYQYGTFRPNSASEDCHERQSPDRTRRSRPGHARAGRAETHAVRRRPAATTASTSSRGRKAASSSPISAAASCRRPTASSSCRSTSSSTANASTTSRRAISATRRCSGGCATPTTPCARRS